MKKSYDSIIIGAGHNGLGLACYLAKAGLSVLVVDEYHLPGGLATTEQILMPGFYSDLHAYGYQLANLSPILEEHPLLKTQIEFILPDVTFAHVFPDGNSLCMYHDLEKTLASITRFSTYDALQWEKLFNKWLTLKPHIKKALNSPPLPFSQEFITLETIPDGLEEYRFATQSLRQFCDENFTSDEVKCFLGTFAFHCNIGPDDPGGGKLAWFFDSVLQDFGNKVVKGGMSHLIDALVNCLKHYGGELLLNSSVDKIIIKDKKATAIHLSNGQTINAQKLVASSVDPQSLLLDLLGKQEVGEKISDKIKRYEWGESIMVIYLALDEPLTYFAGELIAQAAYVHATEPSLNYAARMNMECRSGLLPSHPVFVICNDYAIDPSRVPAGKAMVKILIKNVPYKIRGDAQGVIRSTHWDDMKEAFADRVIGILTRHYIKNLDKKILKRVVFSPVDQEKRISSAVHGTELHGAMFPYQSGCMRPIPECAHYRSPIPNVYLCGSGSHPGPGISFMPARNAAQVICQDLHLKWG